MSSTSACDGCYNTIAGISVLVQDREMLNTFLVNHKLAPIAVNCQKCNNPCTLSDNGTWWRCQRRHDWGRCNFKRSNRTGTFLQKSHLSPGQIVSFATYWTMLPPPRQDLLTNELHIDRKTCVEWSAMCRNVCVHWNKSFSNPIGGPGKEVEVDEAMFGKSKDRLGRPKEVQWIFGGVERGSTSNRFFLQPVEKRDSVTLTGIIQQCILPGTTILSDGWKAYARLGKMGYTHLTVNHNVHFVDPKSGAHIQNIERLWREVRRNVPRYGRKKEHMVSYLAEFSFKRRHAMISQRLHHFLLAASDMNASSGSFKFL